jgi:hypothetical protein
MTMPRRAQHFWLAASAAIWLSACSSPGNAEREHQFRTVGNASTVSVWGAGDESSAQSFAERHCEGYGKTARFLKMKSNRVGRFAFINSAEFQCASPKEAATSFPSKAREMPPP